MEDGISLKSISHQEGAIEFFSNKIREMGGYNEAFNKKHRDALLLGEGVTLMEAPGEGKAIIVRHVGHNEIRLDVVSSTDCPECGSKYTKYIGVSEDPNQNDLYTCMRCEELFEVDNPEHT